MSTKKYSFWAKQVARQVLRVANGSSEMEPDDLELDTEMDKILTTIGIDTKSPVAEEAREICLTMCHVCMDRKVSEFGAYCSRQCLKCAE